MIQDEMFLKWMEEYFINNNKLKYALIDASDNERLLMAMWSSIYYGKVGMKVRNYMRETHPEIDNDFPKYGDFEDYSWELINKLIEKWKRQLE